MVPGFGGRLPRLYRAGKAMGCLQGRSHQVMGRKGWPESDGPKGIARMELPEWNCPQRIAAGPSRQLPWGWALAGNRLRALRVQARSPHMHKAASKRASSIAASKPRRAAKPVPRVGLVSLGCPKALVDSERIITRLRAEGYELSADYAGADVVVVNTCGFLNSAKQESLDAIGEAMAENGRVVVTGCLGVE